MTENKTASPGGEPQADQADPKTTPAETEVLQAVVKLARNGDRRVLPHLERLLDENPQVWRDAGDLVRLTEQTFITRIAHTDLLASQAIRRHIEQMRTDLAGPEPSPLERLLVDRLVAIWLHAQWADITLGVAEGEGPRVTQLRSQAAEAANRQFLAASKALAQVRRLTQGIKIELRHVPAPAAPAGPVADGRPHRLDRLFEPTEAARQLQPEEVTP